MEDDSSDLQGPLTSGSGSDDAYMADQPADGPPDHDENDSDLELQEVYELKQNAKKDFKKSFKNIKREPKKGQGEQESKTAILPSSCLESARWQQCQHFAACQCLICTQETRVQV
jgi:hypothetical protein